MEVKRQDRQWLVRWTTPVALAWVQRDNGAPDERCARCGSGGLWIRVPDIQPLPEVGRIFTCPRCGTLTAHGALRLPPRRVGD